MDQLARQDLGPLSVAELELRITALEAEIDRTRAHLAKVAVHLASAEALFRK